jgi:hypothetical protein
VSREEGDSAVLFFSFLNLFFFSLSYFLVALQAVLHDQRFLDLLIQCGAETTVRTATQQMTVLHILFLLGWKSAEETLSTLKVCR